MAYIQFVCLDAVDHAPLTDLTTPHLDLSCWSKCPSWIRGWINVQTKINLPLCDRKSHQGVLSCKQHLFNIHRFHKIGI